MQKKDSEQQFEPVFASTVQPPAEGSADECAFFLTWIPFAFPGLGLF